ncbi:hypothetical protein FRC08_008605 [Ceratobasidium sp. 394]|nr:hypothetical protein FRC08_008605 [Ceratobasidium sp. 394]
MDLDPELTQPQPSPGEYSGQIHMPSPAPMQSPMNTTTSVHTDPTEPLLPAATKTEKFLLTAADQEPGTRDERLARVIHAKYEAGLLRPYNYVKGYARLSRWMDHNMSNESKKQILQPLSVLRPKFRDLVFIEEAFERLLPDYDRVFSAMGIPACLWRRTGEIYKGNREFAELVGVDVSRLRDKYGHVAFDPAQKAVLASCVLRYKSTSNTTVPTSSGSNGSA